MVVLHVSKSNTYSGMENVAINIMKSMPDEIRCVYLTATGSVETKLLEQNIEYIGMEKVDEKAIKEVIDQVKPDIIHAYEYDCSLMCTKVTDEIPIISHLYSIPNWVRKIGPKSVIYGGACKNFVKIIIPDKNVEEKAWFKDKMEGKTVVLGIPFNAVSVFEKGYVAGTEMTKEKLNGFKSDLLFVGYLKDDKNPYEFIKLVAEIKKNRPDIKAIMVGGGDLGSECLKLIGKLDLTNNIKMVGMQYNPYIYMNQTKILVVPSKFEGFGMAALEAMAFGKPVLGSKVGGLNVTVDDGCGKICGNDKKPIDREAFISNINELLDNSEIYRMKSEGARRRAKELNNFDTYMEEVVKIYEDIYNTAKQA
ncbi:glycosyltransferase family 4 protein [Pseudobutyrivibrio xylanivorans]|nr:glycosyltransferase family 4 protein [Pseudobutyrivibrio xylanivorans]